MKVVLGELLATELFLAFHSAWVALKVEPFIWLGFEGVKGEPEVNPVEPTLLADWLDLDLVPKALDKPELCVRLNDDAVNHTWSLPPWLPLMVAQGLGLRVKVEGRIGDGLDIDDMSFPPAGNANLAVASEASRLHNVKERRFRAKANRQPFKLHPFRQNQV